MLSIRRLNKTLCGAGYGLLLLGGCIHQDSANPFRVGIASQQLNNPFKDSAPYMLDDRTTPSVIAYVEHTPGQLPPIYRRDIPASDVYYESGLVTHWPLWFEDPFETKGNDVTNPNNRDPVDNVFAWNAVDFLDIAYGPARFTLNAFGVPVSIVPQPPGMLMASDGRLHKWFGQYDYDDMYAKPGDEPPDYNDRRRTTYREVTGAENPESQMNWQPPPTPNPEHPTQYTPPPAGTDEVKPETAPR